LVSGIISLGAAFVRLGIGSAAALPALAALTAALTAAYAIYKAMHGENSDNWISNLFNELMPEGESLGTAIYGITHRQQTTASFLRDTLGLSNAQAAGVVSRLIRESNLQTYARNPDTGAYGIAQWLGPRAAEFGTVMKEPLQGSSFDDQLRFLMYELRSHPEFGLAQLRNAKSATDAYDIFTRMYERPGASDEAATAAAGHARAINIESTINVNGTTDPHSIAGQVLAEFAAHVKSATRNLVPSTQ
jgi:hypothetical protein